MIGIRHPRYATMIFDSQSLRIDPADRRWREEVARNVLGLDFTPLGNTPLKIRMRAVGAGPVTLSSSQASPMRSLRDRSLIGRNDDTFTLTWSLSGGVECAQRGDILKVGRFQPVLLSSAEVGSITTLTPASYSAVLLPRAELSARLNDPDAIVMHSGESESANTRLLRDYARLIDSHAAAATEETLAVMGRHLLELAVLALTERSLAESEPSVSDAVSAVARERITAMSRNPMLTLGEVAAAVGLTPRALQRILGRAGLTYSSLVMEARLKRAAQMLTSPEHLNRRIIDIALASGFADISHFNRCFKAAYGDAPSDYRARNWR